ncbi:DUF6988 family protein [Variovorax sp. Sphag1AA]|uniref:DUF6988 family protein n=1 Tax=Variovorax sp. Sphag1AA TaxID=2587027 RepID=UPI0016119418|nr:hypothetical protein [Variovorax sp. Sphag1AA]MBB3181151.1 hypothetical protein [Variovorax sp. Sphag1AA]
MPIEQILRRSEELDDAIVRMLDLDSYPVYAEDRKRMGLSVTAASLSFDHARALRLLVASGFVSSAVPLMRMQFEATTRSAWLLFAAAEAEVAAAGAPLSAESQEAARSLPMATGMIKALRQASAAVPAAAAPAAMLGQFDKMQRNALNSFVHGGIHALRRHEDGYPVELVRQLIECSNGLTTISAMMLAILTGDTLLMRRMNRVHEGFEDCLTPILPGY